MSNGAIRARQPAANTKVYEKALSLPSVPPSRSSGRSRGCFPCVGRMRRYGCRRWICPRILSLGNLLRWLLRRTVLRRWILHRRLLRRRDVCHPSIVLRTSWLRSAISGVRLQRSPLGRSQSRHVRAAARQQRPAFRTARLGSADSPLAESAGADELRGVGPMSVALQPFIKPANRTGGCNGLLIRARRNGSSPRLFSEPWRFQVASITVTPLHFRRSCSATVHRPRALTAFAQFVFPLYRSAHSPHPAWRRAAGSRP